ncbi:polyisoprenoid diphosphate/phosphate phosphohydrolase PLPP6 isoform X2 [Anastrepha ludens]|uniref:polyisoprenoid diphosphate/phosphate phosphohydrolase PLPP6 isoform X2 n=1 Tax=Anastrepha ludens TaxID=28586 RepID=UPI0023B1C519|nr:polyisoprenoid diphosphate/phosphate phosphohydrolase PLPP6 isoform X2 [Anastrepha ludens]
MGTSQRSGLAEVVLKQDVIWTKKLVTFVFQHIPFAKLRLHCKCLEISCNGIAWLAGLLAFIWIADSKSLYQMQLNLLFGLIFDIVVIAVLKAIFRRRRPSACSDMLTLGPDKFSFPSGHASRSAFVLIFFTVLNPVSKILWMPILSWTISVCFSRVLLSRHYILDVVGGMAIGIVEALFIGILWISESTASYFITYLTEDYLPGGEADI